MNVGFIPFFGWRPHNHHFLYLTQTVKALGHQVEILKCDGSLRTCYNQKIKTGLSRHIACTSCKLSAQYATHFADNTSRFSQFAGPPTLTPNAAQDWVTSSYRTLKRTEGEQLTPDDFGSDLFQDLQYSAAQTYDMVSNWIKAKQIGFVFFFNGRMDITRAALEACQDQDVPFASVERSLFNWGIQIYPGTSCLDLRHAHKTAADFADIPLNAEAAKFAGNILATRLFNIHENSTEWRTYNQDRVATKWPGRGPKRVLLLPSSANEIESEASYRMDWGSTVEGFAAVLDALDLGDDQVVMRGHPNWSENIGSASRDASNQYYQDWCEKRGVIYIPPSSPADTNSLIAECNLVVLSHSSAAFEAAGLGKPVINIRPALYSCANISLNMRSPAEIDKNIVLARRYLNDGFDAAKSGKRHLLRFLFTMAKRLPLFPNDVRPNGSAGADLYKPSHTDRLKMMIQHGTLTPETYDPAPDTRFEDKVLADIEDRTFEMSDQNSIFAAKTQLFDVPQKFILAAKIRMKFKQGDR